MEQTECSEKLAYKIQTSENYPEENIQHTEHGESCKSSKNFVCFEKDPYRAQAIFYSVGTNLQSIENGQSLACNGEVKTLWDMCPLLHTPSWRVQTLWAYMYVISTGCDFLFSRLIVTLQFVTEQDVNRCLSSTAQGYQSNSFLNLSP